MYTFYIHTYACRTKFKNIGCQETTILSLICCCPTPLYANRNIYYALILDRCDDPVLLACCNNTGTSKVSIITCRDRRIKGPKMINRESFKFGENKFVESVGMNNNESHHESLALKMKIIDMTAFCLQRIRENI